jgi:NADPH:quinone reductase-like Zn-dependent oxidoreductase
MRAIRLHSPGLDGLRVEEIEDPPLGADEALVEVHAAALTRDELDWPVDRLPAIPS